MANEITVRFILAGFECDPQEITRSLSINPTAAWREGDLIRATVRRHKESGWRVDSSLESCAGIEAQMIQLLEILEPAVAAIAEITKKASAEFSCIVYANDYVPSINFSKEVVKRVADLNAEIDVDLYCCVDN